ncbi:hypothetical protein BGX34_005855 [Mortierella sp. NVP85]|nr:hypothetical protein BGX34_005855 [Mortierella sp. NVP85]
MTNIHTPTLHKRKKDDKGKGGGGKEPKGTVDGVAVHYDPKEGEGNLSCLGEGAAHKLKNMMVVAVNTGQLSDSMCNRKMKVQYKTESIIVKVVDECEDCEEGLIDLSEEAFEKLAPLDDGKIKVKWTMLP